MAHADYTRTPTPVSSEAEVITPGLGPSTPVTMSLKTQILFIAGIVGILASVGTAYFALASTDDRLKAREDYQAEKLAEHAERLKASITKADLLGLRVGLREDMINATWDCRSAGHGQFACQPKLPPLRLDYAK